MNLPVLWLKGCISSCVVKESYKMPPTFQSSITGTADNKKSLPAG